ncbi:two-component system, CitB family, response regulator CitB [Izhakiella capsodis]|uniref:Transcriptional regulatory protein n=1 Tax=Izhakiella capsodis TaxID=1367852 RepID=A0A1I4V7Q9_9GAMM|nr:response regulator [Izhakiella capsodis]SFM97203.1 two-component system, CitB family, response regulator CitB [Izhakiella capsodis]
MQSEVIDVLIVEDESNLQRLYEELIRSTPTMRLVGCASSLKQANEMIAAHKPTLILLDNYLPDGQGITLLSQPEFKRYNCSVIFITAATDMDTCSQAIQGGAFDYILKPISWKRLNHTFKRFIQFYGQQRLWKVVDQQCVDTLYSLQYSNFQGDRENKGIEENTLQRVIAPFQQSPEETYSIDEIMQVSGLSKTTIRRYLEYAVDNKLLSAEKQYGKVGQPRRVYRWLS